MQNARDSYYKSNTGWFVKVKDKEEYGIEFSIMNDPLEMWFSYSKENGITCDCDTDFITSNRCKIRKGDKWWTKIEAEEFNQAIKQYTMRLVKNIQEHYKREEDFMNELRQGADSVFPKGQARDKHKTDYIRMITSKGISGIVEDADGVLYYKPFYFKDYLISIEDEGIIDGIPVEDYMTIKPARSKEQIFIDKLVGKINRICG